MLKMLKLKKVIDWINVIKEVGFEGSMGGGNNA